MGTLFSRLFTRSSKTPQGEEKLSFYFTVQSEMDDDRVLTLLHEAESRLLEEISSMVPALLGSIFRLEKIEIRRGSVDIWVYVIGGFTLISHYQNFVRSLELFYQQIQKLIRALLESQRVAGIKITGGWTSVTDERSGRFGFPTFGISLEFIILLLVSYLIVSHAILLFMFGRFMWRAFLGR